MSENLSTKEIVDALAAARDAYAGAIPGRPAIIVPIDSLHFYRDENERACCVIDMEQIVYLAEDMLRKRPTPESPTP